MGFHATKQEFASSFQFKNMWCFFTDLQRKNMFFGLKNGWLRFFLQRRSSVFVARDWTRNWWRHAIPGQVNSGGLQGSPMTLGYPWVSNDQEHRGCIFPQQMSGKFFEVLMFCVKMVGQLTWEEYCVFNNINLNIFVSKRIYWWFQNYLKLYWKIIWKFQAFG